jgi:RNA polymerase sigma-70 factor (ECF subfamily)
MEKPNFEGFYEQFLPRIHKFVLFRVGGRREVAEDLVQEIFLKAWEAFDRYDPAVSVSAWIYTIARNHVINFHAKQKADIDLEEIEGSSFASIDDRKRLSSQFDEQRLMEAMNKLSSEEARLMRMKYLEGWSYKELAEIFNREPGTLRVQSTRIMKKLKLILKHV